jgi:glucose dehydrogenase
MDPRTSRRSSNRASNGPLARLAGAGLAALKAPLALAALLALATACGSASRSEPAAGETIPPGDWITVNRDLAGTRYSPLEEIDATNVGALRQAWTFGLGGRGGSQAVPVAVGGVADVAVVTLVLPKGAFGVFDLVHLLRRE